MKPDCVSEVSTMFRRLFRGYVEQTEDGLKVKICEIFFRLPSRLLKMTLVVSAQQQCFRAVCSHGSCALCVHNRFFATVKQIIIATVCGIL